MKLFNAFKDFHQWRWHLDGFYMKHASDLVRVWLSLSSCITNETKNLSKLSYLLARCFAATHMIWFVIVALLRIHPILNEVFIIEPWPSHDNLVNYVKVKWKVWKALEFIGNWLLWRPLLILSLYWRTLQNIYPASSLLRSSWFF